MPVLAPSHLSPASRLPSRHPPSRHVGRLGSGLLPALLLVLVMFVSLTACGGEGAPGAEAGEAPSGSVATGTVPAELRRLDPPAGPGALAPRLTATPDGVLLSWLEPSGAGHALLFSRLEDGAWSPPRRITEGEDFFANWADLPGLHVDDEGRLYAHWLRKLGESTYAYGAALTSSGDGGDTWNAAGLLHDDDSATEHGFVSSVLEEDGVLRAFWLDGRSMLEGGGMHLRTATVGADGAAASELLDERVCECCSTDAALTDAGAVVAYRDRSDGEIRDISVVRATAGGWSEPVLVHDDGWHIFGCPVNGPAIAARGRDVALAWFTSGGDRPRVQVAFSHDGGATFEAPVVVDDGEPLGRVDIALDDGGDALVSWLGTSPEASEDGGEIRWRRLSPDGSGGAAQVVAATSQARSAGFPRMLRLGDSLLFVWTHDAEPSRLRAGLVPLEEEGASS